MTVVPSSRSAGSLLIKKRPPSSSSKLEKAV